MKELLDKIKEVVDQVIALKARIQSIIDSPNTVNWEYQTAIIESDGSNKMSDDLPENAKIISVTLRDLGFGWADRNIRITNIAKTVISGSLRVNLFLSSNAPDKSYRAKILYYYEP